MTLVKWSGTAGVIIAAICRALDYHTADMIIGAIGTSLWVYASYKERDMPLLTCNIFILMVLIYGIFR